MTDIQSLRFGQSPNMSTNVTKTFFPSLQHRRCHLCANRWIRSEAHSELAVRQRRRNQRTLFQSPKDSVEGTEMHPAIRCCFPSNVASRTSQKRQVHPIANHHCRWRARDFQARLLPDCDSSCWRGTLHILHRKPHLPFPHSSHHSILGILACSIRLLTTLYLNVSSPFLLSSVVVST